MPKYNKLSNKRKGKDWLVTGTVAQGSMTVPGKERRRSK
jgi:hypothetical protein